MFARMTSHLADFRVIAATGLVASVLVLASGGVASAQAREPHPLFSMMEGYNVSFREDKPFEVYEFRLGPGKTQPVEGRYTSVGYLRERDLPAQSGVAVARNHEAAIRQLGGEMVGRVGTSAEPLYLTFRVTRGGETTWGELDLTAGGNDFRITTVTVAAMKQEVSGKQLGEGIARDGKVAIYDIFFDTGKAGLRPESAAAIKAIAELLTAQPGLSVFVVGHTDNVGSLASNLALSKQRAEAVVGALVSTHGIARGRLVAEGVGQLAPIASNGAEEGRQRNRRVEVVAQ